MNDFLITVLIILGSNGHGSVSTIEFRNMTACLEAKKQIDAYRGGTNLQYTGICVKQYIKGETK